MSKLRVHCFSISLDGYGAGPGQGLDNPLGKGGEHLHEWMIPTRSFQAMHGEGGGVTGLDNDFTERGFENIGAWIMGRNMFGPVRGDWSDDTWKGWWGDNPPYHCDVFVLTHHPRSSIAMKGDTTFHFVTDGIHGALRRATDAAKGRDIRLGGGVGHHPPISRGRSHRRDACRDQSRHARRRRASLRRYQCPGAGVRAVGACQHGPRHPFRSQQAEIASLTGRRAVWEGRERCALSPSFGRTLRRGNHVGRVAQGPRGKSAFGARPGPRPRCRCSTDAAHPDPRGRGCPSERTRGLSSRGTSLARSSRRLGAGARGLTPETLEHRRQHRGHPGLLQSLAHVEIISRPWIRPRATTNPNQSCRAILPLPTSSGTVWSRGCAGPLPSSASHSPYTLRSAILVLPTRCSREGNSRFSSCRRSRAAS